MSNSLAILAQSGCVAPSRQNLDKDPSDCHLCKRPIDLLAPRSTKYIAWENGFQIDHLIPISKGGVDTLENIRPAHGLCNISRGNKELQSVSNK